MGALDAAGCILPIVVLGAMFGSLLAVPALVLALAPYSDWADTISRGSPMPLGLGVGIMLAAISVSGFVLALNRARTRFLAREFGSVGMQGRYEMGISRFAGMCGGRRVYAALFPGSKHVRPVFNLLLESSARGRLFVGSASKASAAVDALAGMQPLAGTESWYGALRISGQDEVWARDVLFDQEVKAALVALTDARTVDAATVTVMPGAVLLRVVGPPIMHMSGANLRAWLDRLAVLANRCETREPSGYVEPMNQGEQRAIALIQNSGAGGGGRRNVAIAFALGVLGLVSFSLIALGLGGIDWLAAGDDEMFEGVVSMGDGAVVVGTTETQGAGRRDVWVMRVDGRGERVWEKTFGGKGGDWGHGLVLAPGDDGLVLAATNGSARGATAHAWAIGLDAQGEQRWEQLHNKGGINAGWAVAAVPGGGYALAGIAAGGPALYLLDDQGKLVATGMAQGSGALYDVQPYEDGFITTGWVSHGSGKSSEARPHVVAFDRQAKVRWDVTRAWKHGEGEAVVVHERGVVVFGEGANRGRAMALGFDGNVLWDEGFGEGASSSRFSDAVLVADGYVAVGSIDRGDGMDGWVVKLDRGGRLVWQHDYGGAGSQEFSAVATAKDGTLYAAGHQGGTDRKWWLMRLDAEGKQVWQRRREHGP